MQKIQRWLGILLIGILLMGGTGIMGAAPSEDRPGQLDRYLDRYQRTMVIPQMAVAVMREGELVYSRSWGEGVDGRTRFYIGSISKSVTGLAVMQLVEQGLIDLDQPVSAYIPEFTVSDEITVRHLLHHVSGMTEFDFAPNLPPGASRAELVQSLNGMTPTYAPGEVFSYFNPNYSLLGYLVERISGQSYPDYLEENIFAPLGLNRFNARGRVDVIGHQSFFGFSREREEPFLVYDLPSGYIAASAEDLARYLEAVRTRDPALGVSEEGIQQMESSSQVGSYGMGWFTGSYAERPSVHHGGSLPGYVSDGVMLTEDGYSIAFLANKNHMIHAVFLYPDLVEGIAAILTDQVATDRLTLHWVYRLFGVFFVLSVLSNLWKSLKGLFFPKPMTRTWRILGMVVNLTIPVVVFFLVPYVSKAVLQRGFDWTIAFLLVPDFLLWLAIGMGFHVIDALVHGLHLLLETGTLKKASR